MNISQAKAEPRQKIKAPYALGDELKDSDHMKNYIALCRDADMMVNIDI